MCEHTVRDSLCAQSDLHYRDNLGVQLEHMAYTNYVIT